MAMRGVILGGMDGSPTYKCGSEEKVDRTMKMMHRINLWEDEYDN